MLGKAEERPKFKYKIDTELTIGNLKFLSDFLKRNYLLQKEKYITTGALVLTIIVLLMDVYVRVNQFVKTTLMNWYGTKLSNYLKTLN